MLVFLLIALVTILYISFYWKSRHLYFHPCKVSGPLSLPFIGSGYKFIGGPTVVFKQVLNLLDDYPDIVKCWFGPYLFYGVSKPEYLEKVVNHPGALERTELLKGIRILVGNGLLAASVPVWRRHRRAIAPTFNSKILAKFVEVFARNSDILVKTLENLPKNYTIDMFAIASNYMLDAVSESLFGVQIDAQTNNKAYGLLFSKWIDIYFVRFFKVWYYSDWIFSFSEYHKEQRETVEAIRKLTKMIIQKKQEELRNSSKQPNISDEEDDRRKPLLEHLLDVKKHDLSHQEIEDEIITFMIAGTDTTATTLCFAMLLLGIDEDIQEKLYDETINILGNERPVECDDLPNLQFTERVIKETVRLFPSVPIGGREVTQDISLDNGVVLPKGSQLVLGYAHVQRNAKYWPDPLKFDPDRFLPEEIAKRHPYTWIPFSYGLRNCIGGKMAMMLLKTVLPTIVRRFKIKSGYRSVDDVKIHSSAVIKPKDGYKISLLLR